MSEAPFPFQPGDWVVDSVERVARVVRVYRLTDNEVLLDLSIYDHDGNRIGRQSPRCGGPASHEPACDGRHWQRIRRPSFPMKPQWVDNGDGRVTLRLWAGERLPPANWLPKERKKVAFKPIVEPLRDPMPSFTNEELQHLIDLFAAANDPRSQSIAAKSQALIAWRHRHFPTLKDF